jgi:hypothetical protein
MLNLIWIELDIKTLESFDLWKKRKHEKPSYLIGFCLGLICGPLTLFINRIINEHRKERSRNTEQD